jgi:Methyltransferase domain.
VLLGHAQHFERLRGVDVAPEKVALLEQRAAHMGIDNVQGFLPTQPWDEPSGSADYVYSLHVFQHMESWLEIANYIQGISRVLRRGGIAHLRFDTRPRHLLYRTRQHVPDRLLGPSQRWGIRTIRRKEDWVRDRMRGADLQMIGERQPGSADHWFVARRR